MKDGKPANKTTLVEVIPIVRGMAKDSLSYFATSHIPLGTFVTIPLRKGTETAIVSRIEDASVAKADIKNASFALRKIGRDDIMDARLSSEFIRASQKTAEFYSTSVGSVLGSLLPTFLLEEPSLLSTSSHVEENKTESELRPPSEPLIIQMENDERFGQYMSLIRQSFARDTSVLFISPTAEEARRAFKILSRGISEYSYLFTNEKKSKELRNVWSEAKNSTHPILFVTTHMGASFDRQNLSTIILERENSRAYRMQKRPYLHLRTFLLHLSRESGKNLILGDSVLSIETLQKEKEARYGELSPLKWRLISNTKTHIVDMKGGLNAKDKFEIFSHELKELIENSLENEQKVLLFGVRKGLAPSTVCGDCGTVLTCKNCFAPIVLHNAHSEEKRVYICHSCGDRRSATTTCQVCGSWNLIALGIGVDRIEQEAKKLFPETKVFVLDRDHAPSERAAKKIVREFEESENAILIGTELVLNHIEQVSNIAVVSLDSLFSIPDFSINERVFYLINKLKEMSRDEIMIQTRNIGKAIITWATRGNIADFYRTEIEERKLLSYPPFSIFIKVMTEDTKAKVSLKKKGLVEKFEKWQPEFLEKNGPKPGYSSLAMILRVDREDWPKPELSQTLSLLTPDFLIKVDPDTIL